MNKPILQVENLVKNFAEFKAVDDVSFEVPSGKVIGLLGPNGAGKTTIIQSLLGITLANGGSIKYFGKDFTENKEYCLARINYASAFNTLQGRISVKENLKVFAMLFGVVDFARKIRELSAQFEIENLMNQRYWDLSTGQRTRVNVVKSLLNDPKIILMDEPTASLDPDIADKFLSMIEEMREMYDLSILYTSHDMQEVERICDQVIFLNKGKIIANDTPLALARKIAFSEIEIIFDKDSKIIENYLKNEKIKYKFISEKHIRLNAQGNRVAEIIFAIKSLNLKILDLEVKKASLEDYFLHVARGGNYESL